MAVDKHNTSLLRISTGPDQKICNSLSIHRIAFDLSVV